MKAWQKGAIIGGIIGLVKVHASILFPIVGAILGAFLIISIFAMENLFTSKGHKKNTTMDKTLAFGVFFGIIYGFIIPMFFSFVAFGSDSRPIDIPIFLKPTILSYSFLVNIFSYNLYLSLLSNIIFWTIVGTIFFYKIVDLWRNSK